MANTNQTQATKIIAGPVGTAHCIYIGSKTPDKRTGCGNQVLTNVNM